MRTIKLPNGKTLQVPDDLSTDEEHAIIGQELNPAFGGGTATQYQAPGQAQAEPMTPPQPQPQAPRDPGALPALGGLGAGLLTRSVAGVPLGMMGGEALNQYLGITPGPNPNAIAKQGELGLATGGAVKGAVSLMGRWLPSTMNALASSKFGQYLAGLEPTTSPKALFEQAKQSGIMLPLDKTMAAAKDMITDLQGAGMTSEWKAAASYLQRQVHDRLVTGSGQLSAADLLSLHSGLGDKVATATGKARGAYKRLYDVLSDEVDMLVSKASPTQPAASLIQDAWRTYKRKATLDEIHMLGDKATQPIRGAGDEVQFNAAQVLRNMKNNRFYNTAFTEPEKQEIESVLTGLNRIGGLKPAVGANVGSSQRVPMAITGGIGGAVGQAMMAGGGSPWMTPMLAAAGAVIPPIATTLRNLSIALETGIGRQLLKELIKGGKGGLTANAAQVLSAYANAQLSQPGNAQTIQQAVGYQAPPPAGP